MLSIWSYPKFCVVKSEVKRKACRKFFDESSSFETHLKSMTMTLSSRDTENNNMTNKSVIGNHCDKKEKNASC